jgi:4-amino-4-deoxy-L-arabinose transferase-like glycosyltransferase
MSASSVTLLSVHSMAWSEPTFIFLIVLSLMLCTRYLSVPSMAVLIFACLAVGLAMVTRYAGIPMFITVLVGLYFLGNTSPVTKLLRVTIASVVCCFPVTLWLVRNWLIAGTVANRDIAIHPMPLSRWKNFVHII